MSPEPPAALERALWALTAYDVTALGTSSERGPHVAGVFFCPERHDGGIRLITALQRHSRLHLDLSADPRVAMMCSPGNTSRWIQAWGTATPVDDARERLELFGRLLEHAPGARHFVEDTSALPVLIALHRMRVVEDPFGTPLVVEFPD